MDFNCNSLNKMAKYIEDIKGDFLFSFDEDGMAPISTQHYLVAISNLELAILNLKLAHFHQIKGE